MKAQALTGALAAAERTRSGIDHLWFHPSGIGAGNLRDVVAEAQTSMGSGTG